MIEFKGKQYNIITLDFETYFDKDYTLTKLPSSAYVRDSRFKAHMMGMKFNDSPTVIYKDIRKALKLIDWKNALVLAHNTAFDAFILTQRFRIKPAGYLDTLSMARGVFGHAVSHRLDNVGRMLGMGGKEGADSLKDAKGLVDLPPDLWARMADYCIRDVELCYQVFHGMYNYVPDDELELIDHTIRMFAEPLFQVDADLAREELEAEISGKVRSLIFAGCTASDLMSNAKFAALLQAQGVQVPQKLSKATGKASPAFAKTDEGMRELLASPNDKVRRLAEARLKVKSTIGETRAQRFLDTAAHGTMPVLLNYYGAHTGRWSGGDKMNLQNLPRPDYLPDGSPDPATGRLRRALRAPGGKMVVVADSSQIEARMNAWLAGQHDVLAIFRAYDAKAGPDLYRVMASYLFDVPIEQVTKHQRFIGKVVVLASGYGMGPNKLVATMANAKPTPVHATIDQAADWIHVYRTKNNMIVRSWKNYQNLVPRMTLKTCEVPVGPCTMVHEAIRLPNGMFLRYPELQVSEGEISFKGRNSRTKLYGGLICENLCQALSRCIIAEQLLTLAREGIRVVTTTHDEIVAIAPKKQAEKVYRRMLEVMSTPPSWAPDLPLAAEGGYAENYAK